MSKSRCMLAEAIGTFFLCFAGIGAIISTQAPINSGVGLLGIALAHGLALSIAVNAFGGISGAHFNPAVTLAFGLRREISPSHGVLYVAAQVIGAFIGVWTAHLMFEMPIIQESMRPRSGAAQWFSEGVATFGLLLTILGCVRFRPKAMAMAVGLYITAAYWFTASTSFAIPAVTIGRAFTDSFSGIRPVDMPAFVVAQLLGAGAAVLVATYLFWARNNGLENS